MSGSSPQHSPTVYRGGTIGRRSSRGIRQPLRVLLRAIVLVSGFVGFVAAAESGVSHAVTEGAELGGGHRSEVAAGTEGLLNLVGILASGDDDRGRQREGVAQTLS